MTCALAASPMAWMASWNRHGGSRVGLLEQLGVGQELQAARVRLVGIGPLQPGAARAERAVGVELDPAQAQPVADRANALGLPPSMASSARNAAGIGHDAGR